MIISENQKPSNQINQIRSKSVMPATINNNHKLMSLNHFQPRIIQ